MKSSEMAVYVASQFSKDGKYFALISTEGKLKVWDTISNTFEQEFTPDFHLTTPCICLNFIQEDATQKKNGSPRKKKRRDSQIISAPDIALGTSNGLLLIYSIAKARIDYTINSETSKSINCLSLNDDRFVYSGAENTVLIWNLRKKSISNKWGTGNDRIGAVQVTPDETKLITASKNIKLWDIQKKQVLKTFTGHSSEVTLLHIMNPRSSKGDMYFISGSKGDRLLNCWNLTHEAGGKNAVASFLMEDIVYNITSHMHTDGSSYLAATVRSGVVHIYQHTLNGKCSKPLKPKTTVQVIYESKPPSDIIPIHIAAAAFRNDETLCIGYGNAIAQSFENITISLYKKLQCLSRVPPQLVAQSKENNVSKVQTPIISGDVNYLTPQSSSVAVKRKSGAGQQQEVPMERRLENLTLNKLDGDAKVPKGDNVAQLLVQGLHSKDKTILRTVLTKKDEQLIKNTIKRLPMPVIVPLVEELTALIQGKTLSSQIGCLWLKNLIMVHAGLLLSNPDLPELFGKVLGSIESRLHLQMPLNRLKGRLDLLVAQVANATSQGSRQEEALLVYNDKESSDSETEGMEFEVHSNSDHEWVEESSNDEQNEESDVENDSDEAMSS